MSEAEELLELVGKIYDAALDLSLWPGVIERTCRFTSTVCGAHSSYDITQRHLDVDVTWGYDPYYLDLLHERYGDLNPLMTFVAQSSVGDVLSPSDVMPYQELTDSVFWREWVRPQGFVDAMQVTLEKTPTAVAGLTVVRHESQGMADDTTRRRMKLLYPHLRRAVLIGKVIDLHKVEAATFADTIDGLLAAIFLVDQSGRIVYANPSGEAMLAEADVFETGHASLTAKDPEADRALREALAATRTDHRQLGVNGIAVPIRAPGGTRYISHILPLTSGARRAAGLHYAAVAAIFVRKATLEPMSAFETMQRTFHLTPNEVRVLQAMVEINGAAAIGAILGMSEATVKTHLHHLFEKTGATRQTDLVKLVAGFSSPLER